jgi:hypothetical protein
VPTPTPRVGRQSNPYRCFIDSRLATLNAGTLAPSAYLEACRHRDFVAAEFKSAGPKWVSAVGYVALWKRLHRAKEALVLIEQRGQVVADALYDQWRIENSTMTRGADLLADLARAKQFLERLPSTNDGPVAAAHPAPTTRVAAHGASAPPAPPPIESEIEARAILSRVRYAIHDFRDQRWAALVKARNLLMGTMIITELFAFAILGLAVIEQAPRNALVAAIVFYLVGALVGLYNRLGQQATSGTIVADYSLAGIRLILTPTISGLAAVGGVLLTGMLTLSGLTGVVQPAPTGGSVAPVAIPTMADIFDLNKFRIGLLLALLFGAAPALITSRLQQLTDQYKNDLKSTDPSSGASPTPKPAQGSWPNPSQPTRS